MIHYLRKNGKTIVDIEAFNGDIKCVVIIREFGKFLLNSKKESILDDFDAIQEIRGEFWEVYNGEIDPDLLARKRCEFLANRYNLDYVTD